MYRRSLLAAAAALLPLAAVAHSYTAGDITIGHPWSRAAGANATGAGYMTLRNGGTQPDRLLSATSPVARRAELHTHIRDGNVMRMRPVEAIDIPPGESVELRPGGLHVMLVGLTEALVQGTRVPLTLRFERAGEIQVELAVEAAGARGAQHH